MFQVRLKFIAAFILLLMIAVLSRLAYMQVFRADFYREEARKRQMRVIPVPAPRGTILARDGTPLAEDLPVRKVCVILRSLYSMDPSQLQEWYRAVSLVVGDTPDGVASRVQAAWNRVEDEALDRARDIVSKGDPEDQRVWKKAAAEAQATRRVRYRNPQPLYDDVPFEIAARAEIATSDIDGLAVAETMDRRYPPPNGRALPLAAHAVGFINLITREEYDLYRYDYLGDERRRFTYDDMMGRAGVEKQFNFELRGLRGRRDEVVNANNQTQKVLSDEPAEPGAKIILTIDPPLQAAAEDSLAEILNDPLEPRAGAAVCMDIRSGEVLVLASSPSYNPNTVTRDWDSLVNPNGLGKFHPFQNRAISAAYPLGSVFKLVDATAGLESGELSPSTTYNCTGAIQVGGHTFNCWISYAPYFSAHGPIDLMEALKVSCNIYFADAGRAVGGPRLVEWAYGYGFGSPTGIDIPGEAKGNVPAPRTRFPGEVVNLSIGQGELLVTPIQVCRMAAAIANGGWLLTPRLRREAAETEKRRVGLSPSTLSLLHQAMYDVVNVRGGTGWSKVRSDKIVIAGKTGTAQAPDTGDISGDHAWFAGFAPYDDPQIAFAVCIEHGGHGGARAGPVAKAIAEAYAVKAGLVPPLELEKESVTQ